MEEIWTNLRTPSRSAASAMRTEAARSTVSLRAAPLPGPAPAADTIASAPRTMPATSSRLAFSSSHPTACAPAASPPGTAAGCRASPPAPACLFDLDGTLIDSVYQHVIAWRQALSGLGIDLSVWRIHRRIGMSGGLFVSALLRETGLKLSQEQIDALQTAHADAYEQQVESVRPLPGATERLGELSSRGVPWAIATSGYRRTARLALGMLGLPEDAPMVTRDQVRRAKPDPDLFLAGAALLGVDPAHAMVVGDSIWDLLAARRAG